MTFLSLILWMTPFFFGMDRQAQEHRLNLTHDDWNGVAKKKPNNRYNLAYKNDLGSASEKISPLRELNSRTANCLTSFSMPLSFKSLNKFISFRYNCSSFPSATASRGKYTTTVSGSDLRISLREYFSEYSLTE